MEWLVFDQMEKIFWGKNLFTTYINSYTVYVRCVTEVFPDQGQHVVLYKGGGDLL